MPRLDATRLAEFLGFRVAGRCSLTSDKRSISVAEYGFGGGVVGAVRALKGAYRGCAGRHGGDGLLQLLLTVRIPRPDRCRERAQCDQGCGAWFLMFKLAAGRLSRKATTCRFFCPKKRQLGMPLTPVAARSLGPTGLLSTVQQHQVEAPAICFGVGSIASIAWCHRPDTIAGSHQSA